MAPLTWWMLACDPDGEGPDPNVQPDPHVVLAPMDRDDPLPNVCDAGDAAWVARVMPLVWGRRPHGAAEVSYWAQMAGAYGRESVVRAMTEDLEYLVAWADWFTDALYVARVGDKEFDECFARPALAEHNGSLTDFMNRNGPTEATYNQRFVMADVIVDALVADDVSSIYRGHLFARMEKPTTGANVSEEQLEYNRRVNYGELFYRTYVGRNLVCMNCHNSEFSTTDGTDPKSDRTWQMPGHFERALLGAPVGREFDEAYAMFRYGDITDGNAEPWGWDSDCGGLAAPDSLPRTDQIGQQSAYFIREYGDGQGSVYDLERDLFAGVESMRGKGLTVGADGSVDGAEAFAYLVGANLGSQVWATATGADLVVAHLFPRNEAQMQRQQAFADVLATSGFSLRELLVAVTADPYFNPGLPATCDAVPFGLEPVFDPWTVAATDPHERRNGPTDAAHRLPARALLRSAHLNLDWKARDLWFSAGGGGDEEILQGSVGVFLRESDPGHRGTDFQGLLTFETEFGTCSGEPRTGSDVIDQILTEATSSDATVGDVAAAVRDRLTSGAITPEEQPLIEAVLGRSFTDPAENTPEFEGQVRLFCGALLESPQFQLVTDDAIGAEIPKLARGVEDDCERVAERMTAAGYDATCSGRTLSGGTPTSTGSATPP
ncbi:MAG: hypothetical protein ABMA64_28275 [Myxococcota bacterium]